MASGTTAPNVGAKAVTLADVPRGQKALVQRIASDDTQFRQRLQSMGVVRGAAVAVDHTAPLGDPRVYTLQGYSLTLRNSEASQILVSLQ